MHLECSVFCNAQTVGSGKYMVPDIRRRLHKGSGGSCNHADCTLTIIGQKRWPENKCAHEGGAHMHSMHLTARIKHLQSILQFAKHFAQKSMHCEIASTAPCAFKRNLLLVFQSRHPKTRVPQRSHLQIHSAPILRVLQTAISHGVLSQVLKS